MKRFEPFSPYKRYELRPDKPPKPKKPKKVMEEIEESDSMNLAKVTEIKYINSETKEETKGDNRSCTMAERVEEDLNRANIELPTRTLKVMVKKCDFTKMIIKSKELPLPVVEKMIASRSSPNDYSAKKILKRKSRWVSDIIQKRVRKEDCSNKTDEIEREEDNEEFVLSDYVEHEIHSNENRSSLDNITSEIDEIHNQNLKMLIEVKRLSVFDLSSQIEEHEKVKVKIESVKLEGALYPTEATTFICQPDLNIKEDSEGDRTEMLQWTDENARKLRTFSRSQTKLITELVEESKEVQTDTPLSIPLATEVKEEVLSSEVDFSVIASDKLLVPDIEKQHKKCPNADTIKSSSLNAFYNCNLSELVPPYNCEDDGFPSCPFKTLYFDEYLKHVETIHQINRLGLFSSEHELLTGAVMEGWLAKEVGPFQCRYCKKATVTHQEMGRHQAVFHAQEQCLFYYRKFVPTDIVTIPEQVDLEDPSFINHVVQLPDQVYLCDFKLMDGLFSSTSAMLTERGSEALLQQSPVEDPEINLDQQKILLDEPEIFSLPVDSKAGLLTELDPLRLDEKPLKDVSVCNNSVLPVERKSEALKLQCKWEGCYKTNHSQTSLIKHIEKDHIKSLGGKEFSCFWINCPRKSKPFNMRYKLLIHMRIHSGEKPHKCLFQDCNEGFKYLWSLKVHQRRHTVDRSYLCQFPNCFKSFANASQRSIHESMHGDTCKWEGCYKTNHSQTSLIKHIEKDHIKSLGGKEFSCFWINCPRKSKPFNMRYKLLIHMRIHSGEKPHKCLFQDCNEGFKYLWSLKVHQRRHTVDRSYLCQFPNCFKSFANASQRSIHESMHGDTITYACQVTNCSKRYAHTSGLWRHLRTHTADEQLEVKRKSVENIHQRTHYKTLHCEWEGCNQTNYCQTALVKHIEEDHIKSQSGKEFNCRWINCPRKSKPFSLRYKLLLHMRVHSEEKPHKCSFQGCNKGFNLLAGLKVHQRRHTGDRPYLCQFPNCFKAFASASHRSNHRKTHYVTYACQVTGCSKKYTDPRSIRRHMKKHIIDEQRETKRRNQNRKSVENNQKEDDFMP